MSSELIVPIQIPVAPHVLVPGTFLSTLAKVEQEVASLEVVDADSAQLAATLQSRLNAAGKALEKARNELKAPFLAAGREIDAAAKGPAGRIETAKKALSVGLTRYQIEQQRIAAEAEAKRKAELERLEKLRKEEEAAEKKRQAELAAKVAKEKIADFDFDDDSTTQKTEVETQIDAVKFAPAVVPDKPAGVALRISLYPTVTDVNKLPDQFVTKTPKLREIIATFCQGYKDGDPIPQLDGVTFEVRRETIATGKDQF